MNASNPNQHAGAEQYRPQSGYCAADTWSPPKTSAGGFYSVHYEGLDDSPQSTYFTNKETVDSCRGPDGRIDSRKLCEKLQIRPQASWNTQSGNVEYRYPSEVTLYQTRAGETVTYSEGIATNNIVLGEGGGYQCQMSHDRKVLERKLERSGPTETCKNTRARLPCFKQMEKDQMGNYRECNEVIKTEHEIQLKKLENGTVEEQKKSQEICQREQEAKQQLESDEYRANRRVRELERRQQAQKSASKAQR